jgi:hypothetical protein
MSRNYDELIIWHWSSGKRCLCLKQSGSVCCSTGLRIWGWILTVTRLNAVHGATSWWQFYFNVQNVIDLCSSIHVKASVTTLEESVIVWWPLKWSFPRIKNSKPIIPFDIVTLTILSRFKYIHWHMKAIETLFTRSWGKHFNSFWCVRIEMKTDHKRLPDGLTRLPKCAFNWFLSPFLSTLFTHDSPVQPMITSINSS